MDAYEHPDGVAVHTGFPNPAIDASLQSLDLNRLLIKHSASTYCMAIEGDTWAERGIFGGDIVLIDRALSPRRTDLVVWWHDDEFAFGFYSRVPEGAVVWGVVTTAIHQFRSRA